MTYFLLKNGYFHSSVQKEGISEVPGCLEPTVTQLIREAREGKGDIVVLWLDFANTSGSIPHKLLETMQDCHHKPNTIKDLILSYYSDFRPRVTSGNLNSEWHRLEKGIITGCTISVIIFGLAMYMLVKAAEVECRGPLSKSGIQQSPIRAFMDDLTHCNHTISARRPVDTPEPGKTFNKKKVVVESGGKVPLPGGWY